MIFFWGRSKSASASFSKTFAILMCCFCCFAQRILARETETGDNHARVFIDGGKQCQGFWVTSTAVVTAAHCVLSAARVSVTDETGMFYEIKQIVAHSRYDKKTLRNDIALLKTRVHKMRVSKKVLFADVSSTMVVDGDLVTAVECPYDNHRFDFCASHCANATCDKNCVGDSGTPVYTTSGRITGIVSGGPRCGHNTRPGGYVSMSKHKKFIARALLEKSTVFKTSVVTSGGQKTSPLLATLGLVVFLMLSVG